MILINFLNGLSLHQDPNLDFTEDSHITIKEGKRRVKYFYADPQVIIAPPDKEINLPTQEICFQLESNSLEKLVKQQQYINYLTYLLLEKIMKYTWLFVIRKMIHQMSIQFMLEKLIVFLS